MKGIVRKIQRWLLLSSLGYLIATDAFALDPHKAITQFHHRRWGPVEGLDRVRAISQTRDGYIWVVSGSRLLKFDGVQFTEWVPKNAETKIPGPIQTIFASSDGSLWVSSVVDLTRLLAGHSTNYTISQGMASGHVVAMCEDSHGTIWAGGYKGLCTFASEKWSKPRADEQSPQGSVRSMAIDREETLWVSLAETEQSDRGFMAWRRNGKDQFRVSSEHFAIGDCLAVAQDGKIWAAQRTGPIRAFNLRY